MGSTLLMLLNVCHDIKIRHNVKKKSCYQNVWTFGGDVKTKKYIIMLKCIPIYNYGKYFMTSKLRYDVNKYENKVMI